MKRISYGLLFELLAYLIIVSSAEYQESLDAALYLAVIPEVLAKVFYVWGVIDIVNYYRNQKKV